MLRYFETSASNTEFHDSLVVGPSGQTYMYPSLMGASDESNFLDQTAHWMTASDMNVVTILDTMGAGSGDITKCDAYLARPEVRGVLFKDYAPYNAHAGAIRWAANKKPCVSYQYLLWDDSGNPYPGDSTGPNTPIGVAAALATAPTTGTNMDPVPDTAFSLVQVHAWSPWAGQGAMWAAADMVARLPAHVRVVTAETLIDLLRQNSKLDAAPVFTTLVFGAQDSVMKHNIGSAVTDGDGTLAWKAATTDLSYNGSPLGAPQGHMLYGPLTTAVAAGGPHTAVFRLRANKADLKSGVGPNDTSVVAVNLDVNDHAVNSDVTLAGLPISVGAHGSAYADFTLPFDAIGGHTLEFRVWAYGNVGVEVSKVTIDPGP